jgi:hypothetical protein
LHRVIWKGSGLPLRGLLGGFPWARRNMKKRRHPPTGAPREALINARFLVCFWFFRYKKTMSGKKEEMAEYFRGKSVCGFLLPLLYG